MKKGLLAVAVALICAMICAFGLVACDNDGTPNENGGAQTVAVEGVTLNKTELTLEIGGEETLIATVVPENVTNKTVTWSSDNTAVATVENGKVTAIAAGSATITAKAGDKTAACSVTVNASVTYTVTEEEWNAALYLRYKNVTFTGTVSGLNGDMTLKLTEDGSLHQISSGDMSWGEHIYQVNDDGTVSYFVKTQAGWAAGEEGTGYDSLEDYEKGNYGDDFGFMKSVVPAAEYNDSFVFDETDNSYKGTVMLDISSDGALAFDTIVKFENKKIVSLEFSAETGGETYTLAVRFYDYGTTEITYPTV